MRFALVRHHPRIGYFRPDAPPEKLSGRPLPFIPNIFQKAILSALEDKALRVDELGAAVGDRSRLYKKGGLKELEEVGKVAYYDRLGYYRPAKLPPELASDAS